MTYRGEDEEGLEDVNRFMDTPQDLVLDTVSDGLRKIRHTRRSEIRSATKRLGAKASPGDKNLSKTRKRLAVMTYGRQAVEIAIGGDSMQ